MKFAVISHDAGSSELLCAFIHEHFSLAKWHIFAKPGSPMANLCEQYGFAFDPADDASEQLDALSPDALLFGTGWQEKVERPYVRYCKKHRIPTVAFLDHWSSYRERFGYPEAGWESNCGDFTAVHDEKAFRIATDFALPNPVKLNNYYLQNLIAQARSKELPSNQNLLFLSEPTDAVAMRTFGNKNYWGFTQYSALEDILKHFEKFGCAGLTIRLHPSELSSGYKNVLKKFPHLRVQINDAKTFDLTNQLLSAKMILGFDTMALYIAGLMNKPVLSYLPSSNREFLLPLPPERQLRTLASIKPSLLLPAKLSMDNFGMDFALFVKTITGKG